VAILRPVGEFKECDKLPCSVIKIEIQCFGNLRDRLRRPRSVSLDQLAPGREDLTGGAEIIAVFAKASGIAQPRLSSTFQMR
jgi:hypothetical protein